MPESTDQNKTPMQELPFTGSIIYADVVLGAGIGPQVCRMALGHEIAPGKVHPTVTLVMPTSALLAFVGSSLQALQQTELKQSMTSQLQTALDNFEAQIKSLKA